MKRITTTYAQVWEFSPSPSSHTVSSAHSNLSRILSHHLNDMALTLHIPTSEHTTRALLTTYTCFPVHPTDEIPPNCLYKKVPTKK